VLCVQVTGAALRSAKHVSPLVVHQLWRHTAKQGGGMLFTGMPVQDALPLLQQPLQQLLAAAARAITHPSLDSATAWEQLMAIALVRAGSWEDLLQLLPLAGKLYLYPMVEKAVQDVVVSQSIAAGSVTCWLVPRCAICVHHVRMLYMMCACFT
jgi:hypothetical protein